MPRDLSYLLVLTFLYKYCSDSLKDHFLLSIKDKGITLDEAFKNDRIEMEFEDDAFHMYGYYIKNPKAFIDEVMENTFEDKWFIQRMYVTFRDNVSFVKGSNYEKYFDDDLYHNYVTGSNLFNLGGAGLLYGITCAVMTVLSFDTKADHQSAAFFAYAGGAVVLTGAGIVLTKKGKARLDGVERTFNSRNAADNETSFSSKNKSFMQLNPSVLMTAQRDMGLGATLSFSF